MAISVAPMKIKRPPKPKSQGARSVFPWRVIIAWEMKIRVMVEARRGRRWMLEWRTKFCSMNWK